MSNKKVKVGDIVKVTGNTSCHNYSIGNEYVVVHIGYKSDFDTPSCVIAKCPITGQRRNSLSVSDFVIVEARTAREVIMKELDELNTKAKELQSRLDWMDETGAEEYDATEHKVWSVMNAVEDDSLSKLDKVKLIAKLVKG